jgi:hypothetical protein
MCKHCRTPSFKSYIDAEQKVGTDSGMDHPKTVFQFYFEILYVTLCTYRQFMLAAPPPPRRPRHQVLTSN